MDGPARRGISRRHRLRVFLLSTEEGAQARKKGKKKRERVRKGGAGNHAQWIDRSRRNRDYTIVGSSILPGWSSLPIKSASDPSQSVSTAATEISAPPPPHGSAAWNNIAGCYDNRTASRRIAPHRAKPPRKLALLHHNDFSLSLSRLCSLSLSPLLVVAASTKVTPPSVALMIRDPGSSARFRRNL